MGHQLRAPILKLNKNTVEELRKEYGFDKPSAMEAAVDILENWVKQQKHFIKTDFNRKYLERTIITTKGSVERAKSRLDKVCTMRTMAPELFGDYDVKEYWRHLYKNNLTHAVLPRLTKDNYRIYMIKNFGSNYDYKSFTDYYRLHIVFAEYLMLHDYNKGFIYVLDYTELNIMEFAMKMNLLELRTILTLLMEGYGIRIKGIHILTSSKLIDVLVTAFKQVLNAKIGQRIQVHKDLNSLHEHVPRELLPKDYGGEEKDLKELHDDWVDLLNQEKNREYQREMNAACTDELLRSKDKFNEEYLGMPGTFRTLTVD
ncbi:hypothetical protein O0L34_g14250 [Tuta absoluta]|nr:hypothetical protein O0L34_g14250 [Tuta absoluta]